ncbi:unnamed protein product, partial [Effrenium voratum]
RGCEKRITLGSSCWRREMCDDCYERDKTCSWACKVCNGELSMENIHHNTGLCQSCKSAKQSSCKNCHQCITHSAIHWGTGLCDACYDQLDKCCKMCKVARVPFGTQRWGSGLCEDCYGRCDKECRICRKTLKLGELHWGTRLCDSCFDSCQKQCTECQQRMDIGDICAGGPVFVIFAMTRRRRRHRAGAW